MIRAFSLLALEKYRRCKHFIMEKPFLFLGLLSSVIFIVANAVWTSYQFGHLFKEAMIVYGCMGYLMIKIISPTQGMTIDYQLIELKVVSLEEYKFLLSLKLLGGSLLLSLLCITSYTKMVGILCILNAMVNLWIFLRNRWNSRIYDLLISLLVVICIIYEAIILTGLALTIVLYIYITMKRVNYESILSLYKLMYKIGQQRYNGVNFSNSESQEIQTSAETLIGKAKEKNTNWCEDFYDNTRIFFWKKEIARLRANLNLILTSFLICMVISMSIFFIPVEYSMFSFLILSAIAMNFDLQMNQSEAHLLQRGFLGKYVLTDIIKSKFVAYSMVNFFFLLPSVFLGFKWLLIAAITSVLIALFCLYKCFRVKRSRR